VGGEKAESDALPPNGPARKGKTVSVAEFGSREDIADLL